MPKKIRLGDLLVEKNIISAEQLQKALVVQKKKNLKLGRTLIDLGLVTEDQLLEFLSQQLEIPFVNLKYYDLNPEVVRHLPEGYARRFRAVVLEATDHDYWVGMADPADLFAFDELARVLKKPLRLAVVRESDLLRALDTVYRRTDEISHLAKKLGTDLAENAFDLESLEAGEESDVPVARLLRSIFEDAIQVNASDIHIEPDEKILRIRLRVDGVLQEHEMNEKRIAAALVLRLKILSELDISEKRLPQDGRFNLKVKNRSIDVRLSIMPTQYGESVVMRLLDQTSGLLNLEEIGMPATILKQFRHLLHRPQGMILVTGPTGSGKTTTLYAALKELNDPAKKIITIEDPVEYRLNRVNQVQVYEKIDLTFSRVLRSALRQDPDIIMIGEIRDQEGAQIALRAAITGHLVLSTLHTNDALTSAMRLIDMGAEGYLVAAALHGVIAQRLVRRICESCKQQVEINPQERTWLLHLQGPSALEFAYYKGTGCSHCNQVGYRGRIGVYELLIIGETLVTALNRQDANEFAEKLKELTAAGKFVPFSLCALNYAQKGITSLEEVFRVAEGLEEDYE